MFVFVFPCTHFFVGSGRWRDWEGDVEGMEANASASGSEEAGNGKPHRPQILLCGIKNNILPTTTQNVSKLFCDL